MRPSEARDPKQLDEKSTKRKRLVANLYMDLVMRQDGSQKPLYISTATVGPRAATKVA
jgi:hypothetical protein